MGTDSAQPISSFNRLQLRAVAPRKPVRQAVGSDARSRGGEGIAVLREVGCGEPAREAGRTPEHDVNKIHGAHCTWLV
jgi:hypothetical protein